MVAQREMPAMSVEEYRALEEASPDAKYEYIDGHVYLMSGGSLAHARIGLNVCGLLDAALGDGKCRVYNSDASVRLSVTRFTYPDATVTCDERDRPMAEEKEIRAPRLIVEVLSDSTEAYDRGDKFSYYRACASVEEYVLVATKRQTVEVFRRTSEGWTTYHAFESGDEVELACINVRLPIAAFYRQTTVPETTPELEGEV